MNYPNVAATVVHLGDHGVIGLPNLDRIEVEAWNEDTWVIMVMTYEQAGELAKNLYATIDRRVG